jgi:hypothetical protein
MTVDFNQGFRGSGGGGRMRRQLASKAARKSAPVTPHSAVEEAHTLEDDDDGEEEEEEEEEGEESGQPDPSTLSPTEKLNLLVSLQSFQGSWQWEGRVLAVMGLGKDVEGVAQRAAAAKVQVQVGEAAASDVLATALVLAYLEVVIGEKMDEWEMLADKAREWLGAKLTEVQGGERGVEEYCEVVKGFLKNEAGLV